MPARQEPLHSYSRQISIFQEHLLPRLSYKSLHNRRMTVSPTWFIFQIVKKIKKKYHKTLKILSEMSLR